MFLRVATVLLPHAELRRRGQRRVVVRPYAKRGFASQPCALTTTACLVKPRPRKEREVQVDALFPPRDIAGLGVVHLGVKIRDRLPAKFAFPLKVHLDARAQVYPPGKLCSSHTTVQPSCTPHLPSVLASTLAFGGQSRFHAFLAAVSLQISRNWSVGQPSAS